MPRSRNWWARLKGTPAECIHLEDSVNWMATFLPDIVYLHGQSEMRRETLRPEVSLCRDCLLELATQELGSYAGSVVAFEPGLSFTQYFFVGNPDFAAAGVKPEVAEAIEHRMPRGDKSCVACERPAKWIWFSREQVASLDDIGSIRSAEGELLCAAHGARKLRKAFENIAEANVLYMNLPYGEAGAYLWI